MLSADGVHDADVLAINAASAALAVSPLPWAGPIGAVRVSVTDGQACIEPVAGGTAPKTALRLLMAGTRDRIVLLEAEASSSISLFVLICHVPLSGDGAISSLSPCLLYLVLLMAPGMARFANMLLSAATEHCGVVTTSAGIACSM